MKVKQVKKVIEKDGWYLFTETNNLVQYRHPLKVGIITIAGKNHGKLSSFSVEKINNIAGV